MVIEMEPSSGRLSSLKNIMVRVLLFGLLVIVVRFAYVVTIRGESCDLGDFCFFSLPVTGMVTAPVIVRNDGMRSTSVAPVQPELCTSEDWIKATRFYSALFRDLVAEGYLLPAAKALCVETLTGEDVYALREIGVTDAIGISKKSFPPLVKTGLAHRQPFGNNTFDFVFSGGSGIDRSPMQFDFASETARTLKPGGFLVFHTIPSDTFSFNSFLDLFSCCQLVRSRDIEGFESLLPSIREIVMRKDTGNVFRGGKTRNADDNYENKCSVPRYKQELVRRAEPLITEEPLKPWITLKRNIKNIKYLPSMVDINFKRRYVYVDVGARSYGSSIGSWFKKQYPRQNKTFDIYAIEADETFHEEYTSKKGVTLLPYAAWVRNETLIFEINQDPGQTREDKGRGMGRIQPAQSNSASLVSNVDKIQGIDFAGWLKNTVSRKDFVVVKMDVEGAEFDLIQRLFETEGFCLIDEIFLECHYNRWQRCCPGERSSKYQKTYDQCLELFTSLRLSGVLVHQWW